MVDRHSLKGYMVLSLSFFFDCARSLAAAMRYQLVQDGP